MSNDDTLNVSDDVRKAAEALADAEDNKACNYDICRLSYELDKALERQPVLVN